MAVQNARELRAFHLVYELAKDILELLGRLPALLVIDNLKPAC